MRHEIVTQTRFINESTQYVDINRKQTLTVEEPYLTIILTKMMKKNLSSDRVLTLIIHSYVGLSCSKYEYS